jgi:alkylhydroperoxidase family enzyme
MQEIYPPKVKKLMSVFLTQRAETTPKLRRKVEAYAARVGGAVRTAGDVPEELSGYIEKIARQAYKVSDDDLLELRERGYSEDQVFEITLGAALGAGLARLERGMTALKGVK